MRLKPKIKLPKIRTNSLIKIIPGNIDSNWYSIFRGKIFSLDQLKTRMHKSELLPHTKGHVSFCYHFASVVGRL
jgi:hypothetical protein